MLDFNIQILNSIVMYINLLNMLYCVIDGKMFLYVKNF